MKLNASRAFPLVVGVIAFAIYLATLAPDLTWAHAGTDGGDLVAAAALWGVPHPPGYPTYTFIGHLFAFLPFGSVAYNINLMSAVAAALACALLAAAILKLSASPFAAAITSFTYALGPMLWGQATIAEVHALNALFVAAICFITLPWLKHDEAMPARAHFTLGLLWGVGLGNSLTLVALAPIVAPALWRRTQRRWLGWAAFAIGLGVYLLIPLQAHTLPAVNWGDARTMPNFLWLISGMLYRGYTLAATPELIVQRLIALPRLWLEQTGWIGALWVVWAVRSIHLRIGAVVWSIGAYVLFATTYDTADSDLYLIPVWMLLAGYAGIGLANVLNAQADRWRRRLVSSIALFAPLLLLLSGWSTHDLHNDRNVSNFAEATLSALPPDAILITSADAHTFSLWYYMEVQQRRPDVAIVDARLMEYDWYVPMLNAQGASPVLFEPRTSNNLLQRLAAANPVRPVCHLEPEVNLMTCPPRSPALP